MRQILAIGVAVAALAGTAFAQCGGCPSSGGCGASQSMSLNLMAVSGDSFDVGRLVGKHPLVILVVGTDKASKAAAQAVQKSFATDSQAARFIGVVKGQMKTARAAARNWKLGYAVLADPANRTQSWLKAEKLPAVFFVAADGRVVRTTGEVTDATVADGVKALGGIQTKLVDPVCGMAVTKEAAAASFAHKGQTYYFCSEACKENFAKDPSRYLSQ